MTQLIVRRTAQIAARDESDDGKHYIEGRAVVYNSPTVIYTDPDGTEYKEKIDPHAFDGADMTNVALTYNHSDHVPILAHTKNQTLQLDNNKDGLDIRAQLANTSHGNDIHELVKSGALDKMSFAFTIAEDSYDTKTKTRTITKIDKLYDVSIVNNPAYQDTSVSARFKTEAKENERARLIIKSKI